MPKEHPRPKQKAVLSDLDGIFFELVDHFGEFGVSARLIEEVRITHGLEKDLNRLVERGFMIIGITNQPDIARGKITPEFLAQKHNVLLDAYPQIAKIFSCEHTDSDLCGCRKPKPGLLESAAKEFDLDLARCWTIGDSRGDIEAGILAGTRTALVQTRYNVADPSIVIATIVVKNAKKALQVIHEIDIREASSNQAANAS